jgi:hypothetical protein
MIRDLAVTTICALLLTPLLFFSIPSVGAQVRQSTNYKIESDSINFGGGLSSSTNYRLESTAGELGTGNSSSTNYNLHAGYQQMVNSFISMSAPSSVIMTPSIGGVTGGTSNGSTSVTVTTDSPAGYSLSINASQSPAMKSGSNSILDYVPSGAPDYTFTTSAADSHLGYSPSGVNTVARFKDNGSACNTGALETALACWDGLSTTPVIVAQSASANTPSGATTTVYFRVGIGSTVSQAVGIYTATTTLTAISL